MEPSDPNNVGQDKGDSQKHSASVQLQHKSIKFLWSAFLNTQALFAFLSVLIWKRRNPGFSLKSLPLWDSNVMANPANQALFALALITLVLGVVLPNKIIKSSPISMSLADLINTARLPLILRLTLFETASIFGVMMGLLYNNPLLGLEVIIVGILATVFSFPNEKFLKKFVGSRV